MDEQSQIVSRSVVYFVFEKDEMLHQRIVSSFAFAVRLCEVEEDMETDKYALSLWVYRLFAGLNGLEIYKDFFHIR